MTADQPESPPRVRAGPLRDWNVLVSVRRGGFRRACRLLRDFGTVRPTGFLDLLAMQVHDPRQFLESLGARLAEEPELLTVLGRVLPITVNFSYHSAREFEDQARAAALAFAPELAGKSFHVRMYRHGFKGRISSQDEERLLGQVLLEALEQAGQPGRITFDDPDAILAVATLSNQAGLSLWTRADLQRFPFLRLD